MTEPNRVSLNRHWFSEIAVSGVNSDEPGIYEWVIEGSGVYVGQYGRSKRPRLEYQRNVARLLSELPYRKGKPNQFRLIHRELARAVQEGRSVTLRLVENVIDKTQRNRREQELIQEHRARALSRGPRVLNGGED